MVGIETTVQMLTGCSRYEQEKLSGRFEKHTNAFAEGALSRNKRWRTTTGADRME